LQTRLGKLDSGGYDVLILAAAGLERLDLHERIHHRFDAEVSTPAVGQGALAIEVKEGNESLVELLRRSLHHTPTSRCCLAERAVLRGLEGGCQAPIAVHVTERAEGGKYVLSIRARVLSLDGTDCVEVVSEDAVVLEAEAEEAGKRVAQEAIDRGAVKLVEAAKAVAAK